MFQRTMFLGPLMLALLVVGVPHAAAQPTGQEELQAALETGQTALEQEDYDGALDAFGSVIRALPYAPEGYAGRAKVFVAMEEYEAAEKDFKEALDRKADYVPALIDRGNMRLELKAYELALGDFQLAVEHDRRNLEVQFGLGKAFILLGGYQQGIRPLTRVIDKEDQNAEAYRLRALGNTGIGEFDEAMQDIEHSLNLNPDDHETHFTLGTIHLQQKMYAEAVLAFADAIERYVPEEEDSDIPYVQGYLTKASAHVELGKVAEEEEVRNRAYHDSIADCDQLLELLDEDSIATLQARAATLFSRGIGLRMLDELGEAIKAFSEAISLNPDLGEAYFRRGICFHKIGEDRLAVADFEQAANILFGDQRPRLWEGLTHANLGNYYEAVRAYGQAIAESDRYTPAYTNRGLAYMMLGEYEKAIDDFNEAIRLESTVGEHYYKRGVAFAKLGNHQKAVDSFAGAIQFDSTHQAARQSMATELENLGHHGLAEQYRQQGP